MKRKTLQTVGVLFFLLGGVHQHNAQACDEVEINNVSMYAVDLQAIDNINGCVQDVAMPPNHSFVADHCSNFDEVQFDAIDGCSVSPPPSFGCGATATVTNTCGQSICITFDCTASPCELLIDDGPC